MNKHLVHIIVNAIRTFIIPLTLFLVSYFIVNYYTKELWGEFVVDLLFVNLIAHFLQWGNKEYLLRSFSEKPSQIQTIFYQSTSTRALFLIPAFAIIVTFNLDLNKVFLLFFWILGLFIYQSAESLIIYSKKFKTQVTAEIVSLLFIIVSLVLKETITVTNIIQFFVIGVWMKTAFIALQIFPKFKLVAIDLKQITLTLPFVIIGFSGLLQSRIDQYIIALFCDKEVIATYQIFLSAFILLQALSAIVIIPFNKVIYRVNIKIFNKMQRKIIISGIFIVIIVGTLISIFLHYFYQISIGSIYYVAGILFAFPSFVYGSIIYLFYRVKKEKEIMYVNYLGAAFNLTFTFLFVFYGNPFSAVIASAIAQWLMLCWYLYRKKELVHEIEMSGL